MLTCNSNLETGVGKLKFNFSLGCIERLCRKQAPQQNKSYVKSSGWALYSKIMITKGRKRRPEMCARWFQYIKKIVVQACRQMVKCCEPDWDTLMWWNALYLGRKWHVNKRSEWQCRQWWWWWACFCTELTVVCISLPQNSFPRHRWFVGPHWSALPTALG